MIKRLSHGYFHIGTYIKPSVDISPRFRLGQLSTLGLDIGADMKTSIGPYDNFDLSNGKIVIL